MKEENQNILEKKMEMEGFERVERYSVHPNRGHTAAHHEIGEIKSRVDYRINSKCFVSKYERIACLICEVKIEKVYIPQYPNLEEKVKNYLERTDHQRIFAYSECDTGFASGHASGHITGNISSVMKSSLFYGITLKVPSKYQMYGTIYRNVESRDISDVLKEHRKHVKDLELIWHPSYLAGELCEEYDSYFNIKNLKTMEIEK